VKDWSLRSVQVKLVNIGGLLARPARRLVFQLAEVAVLFQGVLGRIGRLCRYRVSSCPSGRRGTLGLREGLMPHG
jgi:hypothetical protein